MRIAPNDRIAANMGDNSLANSRIRQLPRQGERHGAATRNHREAAFGAEARRYGAEQSASRHKDAERVRTNEPAAGGAGQRRRRERIVHRHILSHSHDGGYARTGAFGNRLAHALRRRVDQRDRRRLGKIADAIIKR
jgi:hypothetical protein